MYDPDPDDPEEFDGVSMGGSMGPAAASHSEQVAENESTATEKRQSLLPWIPVTATDTAKDFRIRDSVAYSHNYFEPKDVDGEAHAICLMCQEEEEQAKIAGKSPPKFKRKKKMLLKTPDGSTKRK